MNIRPRELASYDVILVNTSAGKDSQAMLDVVMEQARAAGVADRVVAVHCDLGRVEWPGVRELAEEQAAHYGVRFEAVSRAQGDLLDHVLAHGRWPAPTQRYCTSDHKRGQVFRLLTQLGVEHRRRPGPAPEGAVARRRHGRVRVLQAMGMRAEESPARAKLLPFEHDERASNGRRHVDTWLPIHGWTVGQVWDRIRASGVRHHYAYDLGMPRLSCVFCIYASEDALLLAGEHNRELLAEYVRVEKAISHDFKHHLPIARIAERLERGDRTREPIRSWCM